MRNVNLNNKGRGISTVGIHPDIIQMMEDESASRGNITNDEKKKSTKGQRDYRKEQAQLAEKRVKEAIRSQQAEEQRRAEKEKEGEQLRKQIEDGLILEAKTEDNKIELDNNKNHWSRLAIKNLQGIFRKGMALYKAKKCELMVEVEHTPPALRRQITPSPNGVEASFEIIQPESPSFDKVVGSQRTNRSVHHDGQQAYRLF